MPGASAYFLGGGVIYTQAARRGLLGLDDAALQGIRASTEAYALVNPSENDFGHEAVATLLKRMEDDRARLVVVFAGYDEPMLRMLEMNPGLKSRVSTTLHFRTYGAHDLAEAELDREVRLPDGEGCHRQQEYDRAERDHGQIAPVAHQRLPRSRRASIETSGFGWVSAGAVPDD